MTLKEQIFENLKTAMKARETVKTTVLRTLNSAIKDKEIELSKREKGLNDEETLQVIAKEAKKRKDAIEEYKKGGREELVTNEQSELDILQVYLPKQLSEEEISNEIDTIIQELKPSGPQDFGRVMQAAMSKMHGRAEGLLVNKTIKEKLS